MKIDYISDIHIDHHLKNINDRTLSMFWDKIKPNILGDVLIIAGDISHYNSMTMYFLIFVKQYYKHIFVVPGNHDYYLITKSQQNKYNNKSYVRVDELKQLCIENDIYFLDGNVVEIDGIKFGGVGMSWDSTHYNKIGSRTPVTELYNNYMNDARYIMDSPVYDGYVGYGKVLIHNKFNMEKHFQTQYNKLQQYIDNPVDVLVTHYPPLIPETSKFTDDIISTFYYFDGTELINKGICKKWIFGHMHSTFDVNIGATNLLCNALGYPKENKTNIHKIKVLVYDK